MKKITVLIIGLFTLLLTVNNVNAQSGAAARQQAAPLPNGRCDKADVDFVIRYEYDVNSTPTNRPRSRIKVLAETSVLENLLTTHDGEPFSSLTIAADAFNNLDECYTLDNVSVQIWVSKDTDGDGVWTEYLTGTKTLKDIYYYDYDDYNGRRRMTVNVQLHLIPDLTME